MVRRYWTAEEEAELAARYADTPTAELCVLFGRSDRTIYNKVNALGLKKSPALIREQAKSRLTGPRSVACRFKNGLTPWNKGAQFVAGGRSPETRFKPGNKPQTWKPVGAERIDKDGYLVRKVSDTGIKRDDWKLVHVHVWEQMNGAVPKGFALVFKDGNRRNAGIENLELVSRMELMRRNTVHRLPKEIAELAQLRGALNRQINRREGK
jgi:hypothetical protein